MAWTVAKGAALGFGLVVLVLFINAFVAFQNIRLIKEREEWVIHTNEVLYNLESVLSAVKDAETAVRGFVITGGNEYLDPYRQSQPDIQAKLNALSTSVGDNPDQQQRLAEVRALIEKRIAVLEKNMRFKQNNDEAGLAASRQAGEGKLLMDQVRDRIGRMEQIERSLLEDREQETERYFRVAWASHAVALALGIGAIVAASALIRRELNFRKQATDMAHEQSQRLFTTLTSIGDAVIVTNAKGEVTLLNPVAQKLTGWGQESHGRPLEEVFQIVNESTRQTVESPVAKVLREGTIVGLANHTILISKDGQEHPIDDSGAPIRNEDGQIVGVVLVFRDIVERKKFEGQQAESQQFLRSVLDALSSHIAVLDEHGVILEVNDAWRKFASRNNLENPLYAVGQNYLSACESEDELCTNQDRSKAAEAAQCIRDVIEGKVESCDLEYPCHSPTEQRWFQMRVTRFPGPGPRRVVVAHTDISQRVESELAILHRSEQLQQLGEIAAQLNVSQEVDETLRKVTSAARTIIGTHQAMTRQSVDPHATAAVSIASYSERYAAWETANLKHEPTELHRHVCSCHKPLRLTHDELMAHEAWEAIHQCPEHRPPLQGWLAAPLIGFDGRNIGLIELSEKNIGDFTSDDEAILVQLARMASAAIENARLYQELQLADRRKDHFLATLAHELRNPLAPISNALELWPALENDRVEMEKLREMMGRQTHHMIRLIDDLLDLSRITRGKVQLRPQTVDIKTLIDGAVEAIWPFIERCGHQLKVELPAEPISVQADVARMVQVIGNLLHNAAKYSGHNGTITVRVELQNGHAAIHVHDTGPGIPAEMLQQIFEMFTQVDQTLDRAHGGLGIGLTLAKTFVELHNGSIVARSEGAGHGAEFIVSLPAQSAERTDTPALRSDADLRRSTAIAPHRILVVDDVRASAQTLALMLKVIGQEVEICHDGQEAITIIQRQPPDVVFLDIGMPGMDGYEVARHLREQPQLAKLILVALTGYGQDEDRRRSIEAGFNFHLVKPTSLEALEQLLAPIPSSIFPPPKGDAS